MKSLSAIFLCLGLSLFPVTATEVSRGPYLQLAAPNQITIVWRTEGAMAAPSVFFQPDTPGTLGERICLGEPGIRIRTSKGPTAPLRGTSKDTVQYEATLTELEPDTLYRYSIREGDLPVSLPEDLPLTFRTAPKPGTEKATRIWVVGDSGTASMHQALVYEAMRRHVASTGKVMDLFLHVGDMAYSRGTDEQFQKGFFLPYEPTLSHLVCWAAMGNHEGFSADGLKGVGPFFDAYVCPTAGEAGGVASGSESYYSFDHGNIHFIALNSYDLDRSPEGAMARWLEADLKETRAKAQTRWLIAFWHHAPYSKGTHDSDTEKPLVEMRRYIMPILEAHGVDLILAGHSHIYERSMLLNGAYDTPSTAEGVVLDDSAGNPLTGEPYRKSEALTPANGTVSITTGHGGELGRKNIGIHPLMRSIVMDHGSTVIEIEGNTLTAYMLDLRGAERDRFAIIKDGVVTPRIVVNPWTPARTTPQRTGDGVAGALFSAVDKSASSNSLPAFTPLIPRHAVWEYLAGAEPENTTWSESGFNPEAGPWGTGEAGFGYGDDDDRTVLKDMRGNYRTIYIRREFIIPPGTDLTRLWLAIDYDDGFILHANGRELFARNVRRGAQGEELEVKSHGAGKVEYFPLADYADAFVHGTNVLALEGHNVDLDSSDLTLDPWLVVED